MSDRSSLRVLNVQVPELPPPQPVGSPQVLLVEPPDGLGTPFCEALKRAGYGLLTAASVSEARLLIDRAQDLQAAIIDERLPDNAATGLVTTLMERNPLCRSVVVGAEPVGRITAAEFARSGAHVYLRQPRSIPGLLDAVSRTARSTMEWRSALSPAAPTKARGLAPTDAPPPIHFELQRAIGRLRYVANLSPSETMTAWRLLWGDSNKRIASLLGCTERTVKFHVAEVLSRTGARSRAGLLRVLLEDAGIRDPWDGRGPVESGNEAAEDDES